MNKINTAIITVVTAMLVLCMGAHAQSDDAVGIKDSQLLSAIGVIENVADENAYVSRIDFLKLCLGLTNCDEVAAGYEKRQVFRDVKATDAYSQVVAFAYDAGYIIGYNGNFYPDRKITLSEANSILLRSTGYALMAKEKGEASIIGNMGMNKGISLAGGNEIKYADAYKMIRNILEEPYYKKLTVGDSITLANDEKLTIMEYFLNVYRDRGVLKAAGTVSLTDSKYDSDYAVIDEYSYLCDSEKVMPYVGYNVEFYYLSDGKEDDKILALYPYSNEVLELDAVKLDSGDSAYSTQKIVYTDENGKKDTADIERYADMLYNGEAYPDFSKATLSPLEGTVKLIDNDRNGKFDVIVLEEYRNVIVKSANAGDRIIIGSDDSRLDLDNKNGQKVIIYGSDGSYYEFGDIMQGDVLTVYQSKSKRNATVYVTNNVVFDEIKAIDDGDNRNLVTAGENTYEIDRNFAGSAEFIANPITLKTKSGMYLDMFGRVVGTGENSGKFKNYGYIFTAVPEEGIGNEYQLKIFTEEGVFEVFTLKQSLTVGGMPHSAKEAYDEIIARGIYGLIQYDVNAENEITNIIFPVDNTATGKCVIDTFTLDAVTSGGQEGEYRNSGIFGSQYRISESTVIFGVPDMSNPSNRNEKNFKLMSKSSFSENTNYIIEAYDFDEVYCAGALITKPITGDTISYEAIEPRVFIVDKVEKAINDEDEVYDIVAGWWMGAYVKYPVSDDETYETSVLSDCKRGDVLRIYPQNGELVSMRRIIRLGDTQAFHESAYDGAYTGARGYMIYGKTGAVKDGAFVVSVDGGATWKPNAISSANVYIYEKAEGKISKGSIGDIYPETSLGQYDGDTVFVNIKWNKVQDVIIVR